MKCVRKHIHPRALVHVLSEKENSTSVSEDILWNLREKYYRGITVTVTRNAFLLKRSVSAQIGHGRK